MPISLPSVISMRAFQIRLLNWILLANVGFSLVLLLLGLTPLIVPPPYWSQVLIGGILLMLALWAIVRTAPQHYAAVSIVMTVAALLLFTYALTKSQANELRALWFLTGIGTGYILLGKRAGIAYTFASLALVLGTNSIQPHPYTQHALIVFTLATLLCSMCFYIFVSHGQRLYKHLSKREQQYRLLTEGAEDVIWRINPDMTVADVSSADERLRGVPAHEVIGRPISAILTAEGAQRLDQALRQKERLAILPLPCKNGEIRWFEMSGRAYFDARGRPAGYHSIGRDVTERVRLESVLQQERQLLEERVKERTAALSVANQAGGRSRIAHQNRIPGEYGARAAHAHDAHHGDDGTGTEACGRGRCTAHAARSADSRDKAHGAAQRSDRPGGAGGTPGSLPARAFVRARGGCQLGKADRPACGTKRLVAGTRARIRPARTVASG